MDKIELVANLDAVDACDEAIDWVKGHQSDDAEEIFNSWPDDRVDAVCDFRWMSWFCEHIIGQWEADNYIHRDVEQLISKYIEDTAYILVDYNIELKKIRFDYWTAVRGVQENNEEAIKKMNVKPSPGELRRSTKKGWRWPPYL